MIVIFFIISCQSYNKDIETNSLQYCADEKRISSIFGSIDELGINAPIICFECDNFKLDKNYKKYFYENILIPKSEYIFNNIKTCDDNDKNKLKINVLIGVEAIPHATTFVYSFIKVIKDNKICSLYLNEPEQGIEYIKNRYKIIIQNCIQILN